MFRSPKPSGDVQDWPDKAQGQRFIETAKQLGCDEDEEACKKKLGEIARQKTAEPDNGNR